MSSMYFKLKFVFVFMFFSFAVLHSQKKEKDFFFTEDFKKPGYLLEAEAMVSANAYKTNQGFVFSQDINVARFIAEQWYIANKKYNRYFQKKVPQGVVFDMPSAGTKVLNLLNANGIYWNLVWPATLVHEQAKSSLGIDDITHEKSQNNAIGHELGHKFLMNSFRWSQPSDGYGSPGPDWLDEAAAILMENSYMTQKRREAFYKSAPDYFTISDIINKQHPVPAKQDPGELQEKIRKIRAEMAKNGTGSKAVKLSIGNNEHQKEVDKFYGSIRMFIDFLMDKTKKPEVFASITNGISKGQSFEAWLHENHKQFNLDASLKKMNKSWESYIRENK